VMIQCPNFYVIGSDDMRACVLCPVDEAAYHVGSYTASKF